MRLFKADKRPGGRAAFRKSKSYNPAVERSQNKSISVDNGTDSTQVTKEAHL